MITLLADAYHIYPAQTDINIRIVLFGHLVTTVNYGVGVTHQPLPTEPYTCHTSAKSPTDKEK